MPATIMERRAATASKIADLEQEQAVAVLDGLPFDVKPLAECREQLSAFDHADAEQVRRDRTAIASQGAEQRSATRQAMAGTLEAYIAAVESAEAAARTMVEQFKLADAQAEVLRGQIRSLGGLVPTSLDPNETRLKHSAMLATLLQTIAHPNRFGAVQWSSMLPIPDWSAHVNKFVAPAVAAYFQGEDHAVQ